MNPERKQTGCRTRQKQTDNHSASTLHDQNESVVIVVFSRTSQPGKGIEQSFIFA